MPGLTQFEGHKGACGRSEGPLLSLEASTTARFSQDRVGFGFICEGNGEAVWVQEHLESLHWSPSEGLWS